MSLHDLALLFEEDELNVDAPTDEQLYQMYGVFLEHFHKTPFIHKGKRVMFNNNLSRHPLFKGKYEGFVHVVTRKSLYTDRREYDRERANRIHWIKPILDNWEDPLISYFEDVSDRGELQYYYWAQPLRFIVLLRELNPDLLLVTAYCVDEHNIGQLRKRLTDYQKRGSKDKKA